jgi:DNA-binding transcriptional LysR family regulator
LPDVLGTFREAYPEVDVSLDVGNRQHVYERLIANAIDFAVVGRPWPRPAIPLTVRPFLPNELIAIAAARHPLAGMKRISITRLAEEPFIAREPGSGTRETAEGALRKAGRPVHTIMELASNGAIKRAVARGLGVAVVSRHAVTQEIRLGLLTELAVVGFPLRRQWHLVYARDKRFGSVERAFLSFIENGDWRRRLGELPLTE